jgi:dTMP kinase
MRQLCNEEKEDRFERINIDFHQKIRDGYLRVCSQNPERCMLIDASMSVEQIHEKIWNDIQQFL